MKQEHKKHESWMSAITFAEAGEWEMARTFMPQKKIGFFAWLEKIFMAVAFAEAGLHEEALRLAGDEQLSPGKATHDNFIRALGLGGVRIMYGRLSVAELTAE